MCISPFGLTFLLFLTILTHSTQDSPTRGIRRKLPHCIEHHAPGRDAGHSGLTPAAFTSFDHLAISDMMYAPNASGVVGVGSSPWPK